MKLFLRLLFVECLASVLASGCAKPAPVETPPPAAPAASGVAAAPACLPPQDGRNLPTVTEVHATLVHHRTPRKFWRNQKELETSRTLELEIRTSHGLGPLFALDVTPGLYVGDVPINDEGILLGPCVARFTIADPDSVPLGAPIAFDWPFARPHRPTGFRYQGHSEMTR